jgi:RecA-family ATPase
MLAPTPQIPWVLKPWLVKGDVTVLGGEPKVGKSWTLLDLVLSLTGDPPRKFLGLIPVEGGPYRVLYLDAENNDTIISVRLKKLAAGTGAMVSADRLYYATCRGINLDDKAQLKELAELIERVKPDFVVLDSFIRFHRRDENSNTEMSGLYSEIIGPMTKLNDGLGIIVIHHLSKPNMNNASGNMVSRVRGAGDIVAQPDQLWTLTSEADKTQTLSHEWTRWALAADQLSISIQDTEDGAGVSVQAVEIHPGVDEFLLKQLGNSNGNGLLRRELVKMMMEEGFTLSRRSQSHALARLCQSGKVSRAKEGKEMRYQYVGKHGKDVGNNDDQ